jgi:tripartite-type tricarboxylate transporter receptor subunit TctC
MSPVRLVSALLLFAAAALLSAPASAQSYPAKPIRLIVPFTPAGATDVLARVVGEALARRLGKPVVIDNRPGAGGNIGAKAALSAPADGYTLIMAPASIYAIAMTLYAQPGYDVTRDFAPVSLVANVPHVLVANPAVQAGSLKELVALARERPGQLTMASQGVGTVSHLELVMLQEAAGIEFIHLPYKGSAPAQLDLVGGRVQVMFDSIAATLPQIRAGKLKPLAVASEKRSSVLPDVPTVAESGIAGFRAESWLGIMAPAGTPAPVIERLSRELGALVAEPQTRQLLVERGFEPAASSPEQFAERIRSERTHWARIVKASGARVE